jgi:hypothetical protein
MRGLSMPKKTAPQSDELIRGIPYDPFTVSKDSYSGYVPPEAFNALEWEATGLKHGVATLTLHVRDGHLIRYTTNREISFIPGKPTTGTQLNSEEGVSYEF